MWPEVLQKLGTPALRGASSQPAHASLEGDSPGSRAGDTESLCLGLPEVSLGSS